MIHKHDWEALGQKFRAAKPFPNICIDNFLDTNFALEIARSFPSYSEAKSQGRAFDKVNEREKVQITNSELFPSAISRLHKLLASNEFISAMEEISGIKNLKFDDKFAGGGMHMTNRSGILDVHVDFNRLDALGLYRRLNILIYFNEEWQESWGGNIELWDKNVSKCEKSISPKLNRCLIFETSEHSFHGVTAVRSPEGIPRKSFAIYLYNEVSDSDFNTRSHSTIFRARPEEKLKKYVTMPAETLLQNLKKYNNRLKSIVKKHI